LLKKHKQFMRFKPDDFYENPKWDEVTREYNRLGMSIDTADLDLAAQRLKTLQRQRMFGCWHDTSSISNASHFLVLFCCLYDEAIFYTMEGLFRPKGNFTFFRLSFQNSCAETTFLEINFLDCFSRILQNYFL